MQNLLDEILELQKNGDYRRETLDAIADMMEEEVGSAELWNTLRLGFETSEYMENLEYLARELDL